MILRQFNIGCSFFPYTVVHSLTTSYPAIKKRYSPQTDYRVQSTKTRDKCTQTTGINVARVRSVARAKLLWNFFEIFSLLKFFYLKKYTEVTLRKIFWLQKNIYRYSTMRDFRRHFFLDFSGGNIFKKNLKKTNLHTNHRPAKYIIYWPGFLWLWFLTNFITSKSQCFSFHIVTS